MDSTIGLMVEASCLIYSGASFSDRRPLGRVGWIAVQGLEVRGGEGLPRVYGMDRNRDGMEMHERLMAVRVFRVVMDDMVYVMLSELFLQAS